MVWIIVITIFTILIIHAANSSNSTSNLNVLNSKTVDDLSTTQNETLESISNVVHLSNITEQEKLESRSIFDLGEFGRRKSPNFGRRIGGQRTYYVNSGPTRRRSSNGKKKVVIIGEMSDMYDILSNTSNQNRYDDYEEVYTGPTTPKRGLSSALSSAFSTRKGSQQATETSTMNTGKSVFVPVAAYSITHRRVPSDRYVNSEDDDEESIDRMKPGDRYSMASSSPTRTTESAVFGHLNKPEIVEFRGQYFYGPNPNSVPVVTPVPVDSGALSSNNYNLRVPGTKGRLSTGGLLLAALPLVLAPMLSYLFTPMIIPVTATIAAGKRRRRDVKGENLTRKPVDPLSMENMNSSINQISSSSFETNVLPLRERQPKPTQQMKQASPSSLSSAIYDIDDIKKPGRNNKRKWRNYSQAKDPRIYEMKIVANYLRKVHFNGRDRDRAIANYLQCDGLLIKGNECLQRLACEFSDPINYEAPELDRSVSSILLTHILKNEFVESEWKRRIKEAALFGRKNSGLCAKYHCPRITDV